MNPSESIIYLKTSEQPGEFLPKSRALVSVFDHGLLYGDGVFEGIRIYGGKVFRLEEHLDRLERSAKAILLKIPLDRKALRAAVLDTVAENLKRDTQINYIRLVVSRGAGDLGLDIRKCAHPTLFVIADRIVLYPADTYEKGMRIICAQTLRTGAKSLDPAIKSLNYLNNILAKIEAIKADVPEALMLNSEGYVAECTGDNVFLVKGGEIGTPPTSAGILEGITRGIVLKLSKEQGLPFVEKFFRLSELYQADECFLTGTAAEIVPVVEVDGHKIGDGAPGKVTRSLMSAFARETTKQA